MKYRYFKPMKDYFNDDFFNPDNVYVTNDDITCGAFNGNFIRNGYLDPLREEVTVRIQECWIELKDDEIFLLKI